MTPRAGDVFDCSMLMTQPLDYEIIYTEVLEQSRTGRQWFFWVYEKICAIENYNGVLIPIKSKLFKLVKDHWKERPSDFMKDIIPIERHISDWKLLQDILK